MSVKKSLQWRYATKVFDSDKHLSDEQVEEVKEILRLTPSSYGLQPWKFLIIKDKEIRSELQKHSWNQAQITQSDFIVVFCRQNKVDEAYIDSYIEDIAQKRGIPRENLEGFKKMMLSTIANLDAISYQTWADKQAYIALGVLLSGLATMEIDACPIEGFVNHKYDEVLDLKEKGLSSSVVCAVGFRDKNDSYAGVTKVRFDQKDIIEII